MRHIHSYKPVASNSSIDTDDLASLDSRDSFSSYTSPLPPQNCGISQQRFSTSSSCDEPYKHHPWILNKSSRCRDNEKFFVTYRNHWAIISCQYQNCEPDSLEKDLMVLRCPDTKSRALYEALRYHLHEVSFDDTVNSLTLKTVRGTLEVHVTNGTKKRSDDDGNNSRREQPSGISAQRGSLYQRDEKEKRHRRWFDEQPIVVPQRSSSRVEARSVRSRTSLRSLHGLGRR